VEKIKTVCEECGKEFQKNKKVYWKKYCSTGCRTKAYWRRKLEVKQGFFKPSKENMKKLQEFYDANKD
jgi:hypothetical protein